jgi:hypothetical protein
MYDPPLRPISDNMAIVQNDQNEAMHERSLGLRRLMHRFVVKNHE